MEVTERCRPLDSGGRIRRHMRATGNHAAGADGVMCPSEGGSDARDRVSSAAERGTTMSQRVQVQARINGEEVAFLCEPRQSLLEVLRDELGLTGTKEGCNNGNCGACNVIVEGRLVNACCVLAVEVQDKAVLSIEGVAEQGRLHPLQQAFLEAAALQCGICTPGFIVASKALLDREPDADEGRIRHWLAGNLCRCTGYDKIIRAVQAAAHQMRTAGVAGDD